MAEDDSLVPPLPFDHATLSVQLASDHDIVPDVGFIVEALHNLVVGSVWSCMADVETPNEDIAVARRVLAQEISESPKARCAFGKPA